jgi:hypothetical protein
MERQGRKINTLKKLDNASTKNTLVKEVIGALNKGRYL